MGGRRRLVGGYSVWLPDHSRSEGFMARRYLKAGEEIVGVPPNGSERMRLEIRRYAIAGTAFEQAAQQHAELIDQRQRGKGRRPSLRTVERAARRLGLADMTLREATARLEALAARRPTPAATPAELMRRLRDAGDA